jgi:SAM-dependent methyltransferase
MAMKRLRDLVSFNSSRWRLLAENTAFAASVAPGSLVLDAGAGSGQYGALFGHARYESADFEQVAKIYGSTTYVCDLRQIPVEDARFDVVLFNQVMEHVPDPLAVLAELDRVMKPGGRMIYSAPLFYEEHETPYDFYRYTQYAVRHLFASAGFEIERLDWLEGYYSTIAYQLRGMARDLPSRPAAIAPGPLGWLLAPFVGVLRIGFGAASVLFHRLETVHKFQARGYPKNYVAMVRKPAPVAAALVDHAGA